tara:strand:+ start:532 stop:1503 length:972 start_codon:yes stop_codon:yes gene_type:complete
MNYQKLYEALDNHSMSQWSEELQSEIPNFFKNINHGDYSGWIKSINNLPEITTSKISLDSDSIIIGDKLEASFEEKNLIKNNLMQLKPWRKGPFNIFGVYIDAEWQSNMKWDRLKNNIKSLDDKLVLDIGCGNGYYGLRMLGMNAGYVLGIDPSLLFYSQFSVLKKYLPKTNIDYLPFGIERLKDKELFFDSVFSMGVLYHRRDPIKHLKQISKYIKPGGELIIESLVVDSKEYDVLIPQGRYAKMKNVWSIPSLKLLTMWIKNAGYKNIRVINTTKTTENEQRVTDWMEFESLNDFLDPKDKSRTVEGYPSPMRSIIISDKN